MSVLKIGSATTSAALTLLFACGGSEREAPQARCEQVREHMIGLQLSSHGAARETHANVMRRAMGTEFVTSCVRSMKPAQVDCILAAKEAKAALACSSVATKAITGRL